MTDDPFIQENERILAKIEELHGRFKELEQRMADTELMADQAAYTRVLREHSSLAGAAREYETFCEVQRQLEASRGMAEEESDPEMRELARAEIDELTAERARLVESMTSHLLSADPENARNAIVEIRAGTGGEEASLFAGDLFRMYERYIQAQGWKIEVLDSSASDMGGFKEITFNVKGQGAYGRLRFESGGHRVQRVPQTESQGRIHTSAVTVAVLPEVEAVDVRIDDGDLRIDRMRAGGPGGQKVNKTSSAIRITHEPTGIVVKIQDEKSQHKNLSKAMNILRSRIYEREQSERQSERDSLRRTLIGSGDRSERIRTYNFPQNRMTDHRINLTLYSLDRLMEGELDDLFEALQKHDNAERLASL